jgi:hypothetical protein
MAELYESPKQYISLGGQSGTASDAPPSIESIIDSLPADEREEALKYITAPPSGEEVARAMAQKNANGELMDMTLDQYRLFKAHQKSKEVDVIGTIGEAAGTVFDEISKAAGSIYDKPVDSMKKLTPSVIEAFAQGTRNLYGMAAQSADPNSVFFRMKNALQANGDDEASEYQQFMEAQAFNLHSMRLMTGQDTVIMDKDVINPEMTQVMSYIADPTLFIPFGGIAAKGATMVGMGEKLAMASARTSAIKRMVMGGALKWGVGAPIEFMGTAVRNTIDYGLERSAKAFETVSGISAAEVKTTAQMYGWTSATAAMTGATVPLPIVGDVAGAMVGSTTARGVGEAISMFGEQMMKQKNTGRGVLGYAGQALRDTKKSGVVLSKHAKGLLNIIEAVDPFFAYADEITEGAFQGAAIGGGLGYLAGGEKGMAGGIGSGMALGAVGAGAGRLTSDITGNTKMEQIAIQRKLVIEGLKDAGNENHVALEAMAIAAEATGDRRFQAQIDGIIAGLDVVNPDAVIKAFNEKGYTEALTSQGIDPTTGKLREKSSIFPELGDRRTIADVLGILRDNGGNFAGDHAGFEKAITTEARYKKLKPVWERLDDNAKSVLLKQIKENSNPDFIKTLKGRQVNAHFGDLAYAERLAEMINTLNQKNANLVSGKIAETLKAETRSDKKLTRRGQMLKEKLQADGYIDKDGTIRKSRNMDVEETLQTFDASAGWVKRRNSTGQTEIFINLDKFMAKGNRETMPHELFHSVMRDSVFAKDYSDRLIQKLVGTFDPQTGKMLEKAVVDPTQLQKFMEGYINSVHRNQSEEFRKRRIDELKGSIEEYKKRNDPNRVADSTQTPLEHLVEEFGAYYFAKFVMDKPVDFLFRGGEFSGLRAVFETSKESFLDFWKSKISKDNPSVNFDNIEGYALSRGFGKDGKRAKVTALDLLMQDMIRMQSNINKGGKFDISNLSPDARKQFIQTHGLRGQGFETIDKAGNLKKPKLRRYTAEEIRQGKEMFKVLDSLSDADHRGGMRRDGDGNWSGKPNTAQMNALVGTGYLQRAWFDRLTAAYNILDGKGSNVIEFGYLGYSAHIGDGNERVYGAAVPFKNRRALLLDVNFKVRADGTTFANFDTLDLRVIEARGNEVWRDPQVRDLWNGDRTSMEADFYAYLSNASLPSGDLNRKPSFRLLDRGDGLGGQRRDALHQMLGFHKGSDLPYINKPIAEIPVGIRHSVTTFSNDGIVAMRTAGRERVDYSHNNAHLDLSRNFMPDEMRQETTPSGGKIIKHATGYNISKQAGEKFKVFDPEGKMLGQFDTVADAGRAAQKHFNDTFDKSVEGKDTAVPPTEVPPSRQAYAEKRASVLLDEKLLQDKVEIELQKQIISQERIRDGAYSATLEDFKSKLKAVQEKGLLRAFREDKVDIFVKHSLDGSFPPKTHLIRDLVKEAEKTAAYEYDQMYPMEIKSALHPRLAQIFQDYPNLTAQGLLKKLVVYGSQGSRMFQEATEIGLIDLLKSKTRTRQDVTRVFDLQKQEFTGEIKTKETQQPSQVPFSADEVREILDFAKAKEIKVTIEEGARERSGMDTSRYTLGGAKDNYKQTAVRINPEYAHGISGHYGKDTIVHFRTTERIDADGNRHLFIEEVQANNTDKKKITGEYITPEQVMVSKEFAKRVVANRYADELEKRELKVTKIENDIGGLSAYTVGKNPDFSSRTRVDKVKRQKEAFNLILRNYIDLYKQNNSEYIRNIETATGTPDAPYGSKSFATDTRQHWLNTKQIVESGLFVSELEKYLLTSSDPAEIWKQLLEFHDKNEFLQSSNRQRKRADLPSLDDTLQRKVYETLEAISKGSSSILDSIADLGYQIRINNQDGVNDVIDRIGGRLPYMDEGLGRSKYLTHKEVVGNETLIQGLKELANSDKFVQKYADAKIELDKYHDLVISDINSIGSFSHINYGEGRIESIHSDRLREFVSLANTSIDKFNTQGKEPVFPLTSARDWTLTGLKGIIRQAIRDGLDRITLTHPDDSPTVSHMKGDARQGLYGKLIPEVWGAWLRKYGIEIKQTNKLADATIDTAKGQMAEITNKLHDANKAVLEHFEQVKGGEDPATINKLAELMAMPVHESDEFVGVKIQNEAKNLNDNKLRTLIGEVAMIKSAEKDAYNRINKLRENGIRGESGSRSTTDEGISAEAIDRGMTFVLNDRIKRDFLDGKIQTHMMPAEGGEDAYRGGRTYDQNSRQFKSGFLGLYAEQNPDRVKGVSLQFMKRADGSHRIRLTDNSKKGESSDIGHITANISGNTATLSSHINKDYRGKKLAYVVYSEMAERLRAMGIESVDGKIVNPDGVPVYVREQIIGDTRDYNTGKPIEINEAARRIKARQADVGSMGGVDVYNKLYKQARYQPAEAFTPSEEVTRKAKAAGYTILGQHKTDNQFNEFDLKAKKVNRGLNPAGHYFATTENDYKGSRTINAFLKLENPWNGVATKADKQAFKQWFKDKFASQYEGASNTKVAYLDGKMNQFARDGSFPTLMDGDDATEFLKFRGYDGLKDGDDVVVFDSSQIKSAEDFTYDDQGNKIPLSERFDKTKKDIRYMPAEGEKALVQNGFEKSELNKQLLASGHIVLGFDERTLEGKAVVINNPDTMMTGTLETPSGKILAEGEGGLNFVSKFADIWANSKEAKARTTANNLKKAQQENGGVAYLSLTRGSFENALNSHTGAKAGMGILEYFVEQGYISLEEFRNALKDSGRKYGIEFNATRSAKDIHSEIASKFFGVSDSTFERRGDFVKDVITHLAENGESGHKNIDKISEALGANRLGRKIQFAPTGIREAIGLMLSDKRANVDPSHVYAYIEITGNISVEKTENGHKSYPWHIVQRDENGNKIRPRMLIPDKTNYVTDVFLNKNKQEVPRKGGATKLGSNQVGEAYGYVKPAANIPEGKERLSWMPAEGWRDWQSERTSLGSVVKNAVGYVIMVQGDKFKVYNPYKAMVGIYSDLEQAKRRVQRDEPKR